MCSTENVEALSGLDQGIITGITHDFGALRDTYRFTPEEEKEIAERAEDLRNEFAEDA